MPFEGCLIADVEFRRDAACESSETYYCAQRDPRHGMKLTDRAWSAPFFIVFFVCRRNTITHFCFVWLRIFPRYGKYWFLLAKARKNAVFFHNSGKFWVKQSSMSYCLFLPHKAICYDPSHGLSKKSPMGGAKNNPWAEPNQSALIGCRAHGLQ